jgi:hypothetical protein
MLKAERRKQNAGARRSEFGRPERRIAWIERQRF